MRRARRARKSPGERCWRKWLSRRSREASLNWAQFDRLRRRYPLPPRALFTVFTVAQRLRTRSEALGSAMLEAMSFGVPVVAAAVGGIPEVIERGSNGMLFVAGDVEELTAQLTRIADAAELRRELGRR